MATIRKCIPAIPPPIAPQFLKMKREVLRKGRTNIEYLYHTAYKVQIDSNCIFQNKAIGIENVHAYNEFVNADANIYKTLFGT